MRILPYLSSDKRVYILSTRARCVSSVQSCSQQPKAFCSGELLFCSTSLSSLAFHHLNTAASNLEMCSAWTRLAPVSGKTYLTRKRSFRVSFFCGYLSQVVIWFLISKVTFINILEGQSKTPDLCWALKGTGTPKHTEATL